jgi:hypothetical protein
MTRGIYKVNALGFVLTLALRAAVREGLHKSVIARSAATRRSISA